MSRVAGAVLLLLLSGLGCQRPPAPPPAAERPRSFAELAAEGDAHLAGGAWEGAVRAYQAALVHDPVSLHVRYRLGVAHAALGRRDDAARAFLWVAEHGPARSEEVRLARQWLAEAGIGPAPATRAESTTAPVDQPAVVGEVTGRTEWRELDPDRPRPWLQILLVGEEGEARGRRYGARTRLNDPYRIERVAAGRYRLMAQVGPVRLWDTPVTVPERGAAVVDLTPSTAVAPPEALRPRGD